MKNTQKSILFGFASVAVVFFAYKLGNFSGLDNISIDRKMPPEKTINKEIQMYSYDKKVDTSDVIYFLQDEKIK